MDRGVGAEVAHAWKGGRGDGLAQRASWWLRAAADRLDGGETMVVISAMTHYVSRVTEFECLAAGFGHSMKLIREILNTELRERLFTREAKATDVWRLDMAVDAQPKPDASRRSRAAWWLRRKADDLSGATSVRTYIRSDPVIGQEEVRAAFDAGVRLYQRLLEEEVRAGHAEGRLKEVCAHLYGGD